MFNYSVIRKSETRTAIIELCNDGILRVMLKKNSEIGFDDALENINAYEKIAQGVEYAFLITSENDTVIYTDGARKSAKKHESLFPKLCMAVVMRSLAHKLIANFYYKVFKPNFPFKVFDDLNEAELWCKQQIEAQKNKKV